MTELIAVKGYRNGVTLILNDSESDFQKILTQLKVKLSHPNFFNNAVVDVDLGQREALSPEQLASLNGVLSARNIQIKNVIVKDQKPKKIVKYLTGRPPARAATPDGETLMVNRMVRSGQRLSYPGSIVLIGDVHPGGEIIAKEHIIVWGSLRGIAHAGSEGNEKALIIALHLAPAQLRIAHYIACPQEQSFALPKTPEIAYLQENAMIIEEVSQETLQGQFC